MIYYPNAKINLGLHVVEKREDGFHNIETVFYPIGWSDILELVIPTNRQLGLKFTHSGIEIPGATGENLCERAYALIAQDYALPAIDAHLHKLIPIGAGLGGGSSDAAFFIRALNEVCELNLAWGELHHYAKQLGADCSFFIANKPVIAEQKGDVFESIQLDLSAYHILVVHPGIHVSTPDAYRSIAPKQPALQLETWIQENPVSNWREHLINDFEISVFAKHPEIQILKNQLYQMGAVYAAMSGSGSAVFGLFEKEPQYKTVFGNAAVWCGKLN
ncbi:MAG: 4-(cytidine 5'-diphospho)-2-C-methyl-D-erythritol kinase [Bacteroidia bacterium]